MKQFTLFTFFLSVLLLFSCTEDDAFINADADFTELEIALQNDKDYQKLMTHRNTFFTTLQDGEINLSGVTDQIGDFAEADFCELKNSYSGQLVFDVKAFSEFYCKDRILLRNVISKHPKYQLFAGVHYQLAINGEILKIDCLTEFNYRWNAADESCDNYCDLHDAVIGAYDYCCSRGGDGCP